MSSEHILKTLFKIRILNNNNNNKFIMVDGSLVYIYNYRSVYQFVKNVKI